MEYERWLLEDAPDFEFDGRGYRFEPECTQEELREMEARATEAPEAPAEAVPRITGNWWCACGKCRQMPTEHESRCCTEWDLVVTAGMANLNVSVDETVSPCISINEVRQLLNKTVLETFFWVPKINWKKRPTPEGPNGQLSDRQYRLVAYRVILEWALKGQPLGRGNRLGLPSCVVWAVRDAFPSPTGQYAGFKPSEIEDLF
ncbi:P2X purinoceptor 7-like [Gadus macrocephalus]|uniref:P2X purinoceptor 7-like n=1 Tax=Gadus macrocephalus TaxID=80720 RepID=UPI0028CB225D|nr:P2X purinoceptor 7-like [Gadus macrocephalus]